jgi:hypothetical protein
MLKKFGVKNIRKAVNAAAGGNSGYGGERRTTAVE